MIKQNILHYLFSLLILAVGAGSFFWYNGQPYLDPSIVDDLEQVAQEWQTYREEICKGGEMEINEVFIDRVYSSEVWVHLENNDKKDIFNEPLSSPEVPESIRKLKTAIRLVRDGSLIGVRMNNLGEYIRYSIYYSYASEHRRPDNKVGLTVYCIKHTAPEDCEEERSALHKPRTHSNEDYRVIMQKEEELQDCLFYFEKQASWAEDS